MQKPIELKTKIVEIGEDDRTVFKAVLNNEKVLILRTDINEYSDSQEHVFCDYLKKEEVATFFDSIEIEEYIITNDMCGGHYRYGENPIGKSITVQFSVHEIINNVDREFYFNDGMWFTTMDNEELVGDIAEVSRDMYIKTFQDKLGCPA